jgi:hypothetical protein
MYFDRWMLSKALNTVRKPYNVAELSALINVYAQRNILEP